MESSKVSLRHIFHNCSLIARILWLDFVLGLIDNTAIADQLCWKGLAQLGNHARDDIPMRRALRCNHGRSGNDCSESFKVLSGLNDLF